MRASRRALAAVLLALLAIGLVPLFQANLLAPIDAYFFSNYDKESQSLVLAKIAEDVTTTTRSSWGLVVAQPDIESPYNTFSLMHDGAKPTATSYAAYPSQLGVQGYLFEGMYRAGCNTLTCLNTAESAGFSFVLVGFLVLLAMVTRRSVAIVFLGSTLCSPWLTSAAHNLYWVPWTWLLPASAACLLTLSTTRRRRILSLIAVGVAVAIKSSMGYEYISTVVLTAALVPLASHLLGRPSTWRAVLRTVAGIVGVSVVAFAVVIVAHALEYGAGDIGAGFAGIIHDALKRTYGSAALGADGITVASLKASPLVVLGIYLFQWRTNVFTIGLGPPFQIGIGSGSFWVLIVIGGALIAVDLWRSDPRWRRNAMLLGAAASAPLSWYILAKAHSYTAPYVNFVLWYVPFLPILAWVILDSLRSAAPHLLHRERTALRSPDN